MDIDPDANIVIVSYGTGNLNSVSRALGKIGIRSIISSHAEDMARAKKIILPGVGHFQTAMRNLRRLGLINALNDAVLVKRTPTLGICLGMELMARASEEGNAPGLAWVEAQTVRFNIPEAPRLKIPHMGWNRIRIKKDSRLMSGVDDVAEFYFAHSYHLAIEDRSDLLSETEYGITFPSAIERDNIFGVQFHPEKSHDAGARILKNFVEM